MVKPFFNKCTKKLLAFLCFELILIPGILFSRIGFIDSFIWIPLARASKIESSGEISIAHASYDLIMFSLSSVFGLDLEILPFIPIGTLIVPLIIYIVAKRFTNSYLLSVGVAAYVALDFTLVSEHYGTFAYAWTRTLFILFILLFIQYSRSRKIEFVPLILILFISTFFLHPTYLVWMIIFSIGFNVLTTINLSLGRTTSFKTTYHIVLSFFIIFLTFNKIFYNAFLIKIIESDISLISSMFTTIIWSFLGHGTVLEPFEIPPLPFSVYSGYASLFRTFFIGLCIVIFFITFLLTYRNMRKKSKGKEQWNDTLITSLSMIIIGIGHTLGYAMYGHISFRYITFCFPFITTLYISKISGKRILKLAYISILLIIVCSILLSFVDVYYNQREKVINEDHIQIEEGSEWVLEYNKDFKVYSSTTIEHQMSFEAISNGRNYSWDPIESDTYGQIAGGNSSDITDNSLIIFNKRTTIYSGWQLFEPYEKNEMMINQNSNLLKVYETSDYVIYKKG